MKRIAIVSSVFLLFAFMSCSNKESMLIRGVVNNPGNVKVISFYEGDNKLDSVFLADGNQFKFERPATQERLLTIKVGNNNIPLIVEPGKELSITLDLQQPQNYKISGSELSNKLKAFAPLKENIDHVRDSLQAVFTKATADLEVNEVQSLRAEMLLEFEPSYRKFTADAVSFAKEHHDLAGFYVMSTLDYELAEAELIAYSEEIKDKFLENRYVNDFKAEVEKLKKLAIGQHAPPLEGFTPTNKAVKLSDLAGKYVLIDFWASWCAPCRQENPNIVKQYQRFKDKNFTVLGVSLDDNPGSWMRAIEDDHMEWVNISDLKAWSSPYVISYSIKGIPTSYLIDTEGRIVAKNLRGKALEDFLVKTLN